MARPAARHFGPARARHDLTTTGPRPAQPEAPGRAWAATLARGMAQARPAQPAGTTAVRSANSIFTGLTY